MKKINIRCHSNDTLVLTELTEFQGSLKERTVTDIEKITASIIEFGFSFPFFVWHYERQNFIIDGHGRLQALKALEGDGYEIPPLPVIYIKADNIESAKRLLLHVNSLYGETNRDALYALIEESGADASALSFPEIDYEFQEQPQDIFSPMVTPEIDTSEIDESDIIRASDKVFDVGEDKGMVEFVCRSCGSKMFVKHEVINRYLRGEYV